CMSSSKAGVGRLDRQSAWRRRLGERPIDASGCLPARSRRAMLNRRSCLPRNTQRLESPPVETAAAKAQSPPSRTRSGVGEGRLRAVLAAVSTGGYLYLSAQCCAPCHAADTPQAARLAADLPVAPAAMAPVAPAEVRALWVVRSSLTSPAAIRTIVAQAR